MIKKMMMMMYVIYYNPTDHPNKYVVRAQYIVARPEDAVKDDSRPGIFNMPDDDLAIATDDPRVFAATTAFVVDTLEAARQKVPRGLTRMDRHPDDFLAIVETWF